MRKAVFTFLLAIIIVPVVLLTSSCKKDDSSPVGLTHPFAGAWAVGLDTSSVEEGQLIVSVDGSFYINIPLYTDSTFTTTTVRKISGTVATDGRVSGIIKNTTTGAQIGTMSGTFLGTGGSGSYINSSVPVSGIWVAVKE